MQKRVLYFILILTFISPLLGFTKSLNNLNFTTENTPPLNFIKDNKIQGISVDLLDLILKKLKSKQSIENITILPWARAYNYVLNNKNNVLFSMTRTKEREELFKWVGPITSTKVVLFGKKSKKIKIESIRDIEKYKIGTIINDVGDQLLHSLNIDTKQIYQISGLDSVDRLVKMIEKDRFDLICYEENVLKWELHKFNLNLDEFETVYTIKNAEVYYAFNKDTKDEIIYEMQIALDELKKSKEYQLIIDKYLTLRPKQ